MPSKKKPPRKLKQRSIATRSWQHMPFSDRSVHTPIGSVFYVTENSRRGLGMDDAYRLEWGVKGKNRGNLRVHGSAEQARALMTHAYLELRITEDKPSKETVQDFIRSFCIGVPNAHNGLPMWQIAKDIPHADIATNQYQRAQSFLRSLLVRTLRNLYESVTGEKIS